MSMIDRAMREVQQPAVTALELSVPEALAAVLVCAVSVDGVVKVEESTRLQGIVSGTRLFRQAGDARPMDRAIALLNEHGMEPVLSLAAHALPPELRATAFALATDLVLSDGRADAAEKAFIDVLQHALEIDDATALKIIEVMLIRNRA
jgi:hypothetical protein